MRDKRLFRRRRRRRRRPRRRRRSRVGTRRGCDVRVPRTHHAAAAAVQGEELFRLCRRIRCIRRTAFVVKRFV